VVPAILRFQQCSQINRIAITGAAVFGAMLLVDLVSPVLGSLTSGISASASSDDTITLNKDHTTALLKVLGTYEGNAQPRRIMGAMMTGVWKVRFLQEDSGVLRCETSLRLHDSENGLGKPSTSKADVKIYKASSDGEYSIRAEGAFSKSEPDWTIAIDGIALASGRQVDRITLFDKNSYEITLHRQ
jgi:hypothetical protein